MGSVKKFFVRCNGDEAEREIFPTLFGESLGRSFVESLGAVPLLITTEDYYPAVSDANYDLIRERILKTIEEEIHNNEKDLTGEFMPETAGALNYNHGPEFKHPYLIDPDTKEGMVLDETFMAIGNFILFEGDVDEPLYFGQVFNNEGRTTQMTDMVLIENERTRKEVGAASYPVYFYKKNLDHVKKALAVYLKDDGLLAKVFNHKNTLHEAWHLLCNAPYHPEINLKFNKKYMSTDDIHAEANFEPKDMRKHFYFIETPLGSRIGQWALYDIYTKTYLEEIAGSYYISVTRGDLDYWRLMSDLSTVTEQEHEHLQQGEDGNRLNRLVLIQIPKVYVQFDAQGPYIPAMRYWCFEFYIPDEGFRITEDSVLHRRRQVYTPDLESTGFLTDHFSLIGLPQLIMDFDFYSNVNFQRIEGELGYLTVPLED